MYRAKKLGLTKLLKTFKNSEVGTISDSNMYDITISNLQLNTADPDSVKRSFETFGKIKEIKCFTTVAFIKYEKPASCKRCLADSRERVRPCNYWDQYLYREDLIGEPEILKLNDDCLHVIFDRLKFEDRISLAITCKQLMNAFKSKEKYDEIDLDQEPFRDERKLQSFLDCFAPDIQSLVNTSSDNMIGFQINLLELIVDTCNNVTTIKFFKKEISQKTLISINSVSKLKVLSLVQCCLLESSLLTLSSLQNLVSLDISRTVIQPRGQILPKFQNLKNLNVSGCYYLDHNGFIALCIDHPQLITLDMRRSPKLKEESLHVLIFCCKQIETLKVNDHFVKDEVLKRFADLKHLSELDLSYCEGFTTQGLLDLMNDSPNLKCINVKGCSLISKKFLLKAIELLQKQSQRIERCEIVTTLEKDENILDRMKEEPLVLIKFE